MGEPAIGQPLGETLHSCSVNRTADTLELSNNITIEVIRPASFRTLRGPTSVMIVADEVAYWANSRLREP